MKNKYFLNLILFFSMLLLVGCQSTSPLPSEDFQSIRNNITQFSGKEIRLGGKVTSVSTDANEVTMEILSIPLELGQPKLSAHPDGRFVGVFRTDSLPAHISPLQLNGRFLTVIGVVAGPALVDNRIGYFSTFSVNINKLTLLDFRQLALSQQLIIEKNNSLDEIKAMIEVKVKELQYLKSLLPR